jgi:hypothetical protein
MGSIFRLINHMIFDLRLLTKEKMFFVTISFLIANYFFKLLQVYRKSLNKIKIGCSKIRKFSCQSSDDNHKTNETSCLTNDIRKVKRIDKHRTYPFFCSLDSTS